VVADDKTRGLFFDGPWRREAAEQSRHNKMKVRPSSHQFRAGDATCRRLMTTPGVGPLTAVAYVAALEKPDTFKRSRAVGAWLGLTPRRFQSGEVDYEGHISRRGGGQLRALLYEAAAVLLTRVRKESALRNWGLSLWKRVGFKRAATALARRMAVVLHAMWKTGTPFNPTLGAVAP
jgi:transposase